MIPLVLLHLRQTSTALAATLLLALALPASAAGGGGGSERLEGSSPEYQRALAFIESEQWGDAIALLQAHVKRARNDADGHNWLAYAYRKSGRLDLAFVHYKRALSLAPTHRGAHEYIGEAYLMAGQPQQAEYHLAELARICASSCEEYEDLKTAITEFRTRAAQAPRSP